MSERYLGLTNTRTLGRHHADTEQRAIEPEASYVIQLNGGGLQIAISDAAGNLRLAIGRKTVSVRVVGRIVAGDIAPDAAWARTA